MRTTFKIIGGLTLAWLFASSGIVHGQQATATAADFSNININLQTATDEQVMLQAIESTPPMPFASLPPNQQHGTF